MARKIKFALELKDGVKVRRDLGELRQNFDIAKIKEYFASGKLAEWLEDRYYDAEASKIRSLDSQASEFSDQLCEILGVKYTKEDDTEIDIEVISRINEKKALLQQKTNDKEIIANAAVTAFSQEDLSELLDEDVSVIYLCGDEFTIPVRVREKKYVGILGKPKVIVNIVSYAELVEKQIVLANVDIIADGAETTSTAVLKTPSETTQNIKKDISCEPMRVETHKCTRCGYMSNDEEITQCPKCYSNSMESIYYYKYDDDDDDDNGVLTKGELRKIVKDSNKYCISSDDDHGERWQFIQFGDQDATDKISDMQKKMALKLVCKKKYKEEDIIRIAVDENVSGGLALTIDSLCIGGSLGNAIIPYSKIVELNMSVTASRIDIYYKSELEKTESIQLNNMGDISLREGMIFMLNDYLGTVKNYYAVS